jgi:hypothetical protein
VLEPWQRQMLGEALAFDSEGHAVWRSVVMIAPRKNGKTMLLAARPLSAADRRWAPGTIRSGGRLPLQAPLLLASFPAGIGAGQRVRLPLVQTAADEAGPLHPRMGLGVLAAPPLVVLGDGLRVLLAPGPDRRYEATAAAGIGLVPELLGWEPVTAAAAPLARHGVTPALDGANGAPAQRRAPSRVAVG